MHASFRFNYSYNSLNFVTGKFEDDTEWQQFMRDFARRVTTDGLSLVRGWALSETMDGMDHELFVYDSLPDSESALAYFDYWNKALASSNVSEVPFIIDENTRIVFTGMCDSAKAQYSGYRTVLE